MTTAHVLPTTDTPPATPVVPAFLLSWEPGAHLAAATPITNNRWNVPPEPQFIELGEGVLDRLAVHATPSADGHVLRLRITSGADGEVVLP